MGVGLLGIAKMTGESLGYGDGLLFLVTGIYLGGWDNCSLLMTSLVLAFVFAIIQILVRKKVQNQKFRLYHLYYPPMCYIWEDDHMKKIFKSELYGEASMVMPLVLFFYLSGFALGISLCQEVQRHRFTLHDYRNYRVQIFLKEAKC